MIKTKFIFFLLIFIHCSAFAAAPLFGSGWTPVKTPFVPSVPSVNDSYLPTLINTGSSAFKNSITSPLIQEWIHDYSSRGLFNTGSGNLMTVWSGFKLIRYHGKPAQGFKDVIFSCPNSTTGNCPISQLAVQPSSDSKTLIVYLSGIFSESSTSTLMRQGQMRLLKTGHHIMTTPNPFSLSYLEAKFPYEPGDILEEASTLSTMIQQGIEQTNLELGKVQINSVILIGESYGAFLSLVTANLYKHLPIQQLLLFNPPAKLYDSMIRADSLLDDEENRFFDEGCAKLINEKGPWLTEMLLASRESDISNRYNWPLCQSAILGFAAFQHWLKDFAIKLDLNRNISFVPTEPKARQNWERKFRFHDFLKQYSPKALLKFQSRDNIQDIQYWLNSVADRNISVTLLTTQDDFLNDPLWWQGTPAYVLPYGGHYGYSAMSHFEQLLLNLTTNK